MFDNISEQAKNAVIYTFAAIGATLVAVATCFGVYKGGRALHTKVTVPMVNRMSDWFKGQTDDPYMMFGQGNKQQGNKQQDDEKEEEEKEKKEEEVLP